MRVRIIVESDLGDIEVNHEQRLRINGRERLDLAELVDKAVEQVRDAYGIHTPTSDKAFAGVPDTRQRGGGRVGAKEPEGSYLINANDTTALLTPEAEAKAEQERRGRHRTT